ncbi:MAG TPA: 5-(carboxyamino)imidazole ribonucleotide synthase [Kiritimatiellia bacterium]|nr:5-(carboxyamino)imidazole ribonucleotide synthase [Kiritimatiellia bacterium]
MESNYFSNPSRPPVIGILGGGQLAKMLAAAARPLGVHVRILSPSPEALLPGMFDHPTIALWTPKSLRAFAQTVDVITLESEFVDADLLEAAAEICPVFPHPSAIRIIQDKLTQRNTLHAENLPVSPYQPVECKDDIEDFAHTHGWPLVLKKRRNGYDGKGNATLTGPESIPAAWNDLRHSNAELYVEAWCPFEREVAMMITRGQDGQIATYPVVDTVQKDHICHHVTAPSSLQSHEQQEVATIATKAVAAFNLVGSVGVELFRQADGTLLINEMAPRVHNSGHYTIEACHCSQFENHIRAILGWPLGDASLRVPAAAMVNLLGQTSGPGWPRNIEAALHHPSVSLHIYGKAESRPGRKMGHLTATGHTRDQALSQALQAAQVTF